MACPQTLSGIAKDCEPSIGGIKVAYIANHDDVTAVTVSSEVISAITMQSSAKFKKYEFRRGTSNFVSKLNVDPATGTHFVSTDITFVFSRMETAKRVEMSALSLGDLVIIIEDMNGKFWFFGKDEAVSAADAGAESGTVRTDANRYSIVLQDNAKDFVYEVDADIIAGLIA